MAHYLPRISNRPAWISPLTLTCGNMRARIDWYDVNKHDNRGSHYIIISQP